METKRGTPRSGLSREALCKSLRRLQALMFVPLTPLLGAGVADLVYYMKRGAVPVFLRHLTYHTALFSIPCFIVVVAGWVSCKVALCRLDRREADGDVADPEASADATGSDGDET